MIPFFFTTYRKAPLATCVSFVSSLFYVLAVYFCAGYFMNWSGMKDELSLGICLLMGALFAALGFGGGKLAEWLALRKRRKLAAKAAGARPAPAPVPASAPPPSAAPDAFCPKCGARAEPGDVFCVNCGAKL